jgi:hypothetical protein
MFLLDLLINFGHKVVPLIYFPKTSKNSAGKDLTRLRKTKNDPKIRMQK